MFYYYTHLPDYMRKLSTNTALRELCYCVLQNDPNKIALIKRMYDINSRALKGNLTIA